jgi:hypothetical protein
MAVEEVGRKLLQSAGDVLPEGLVFDGLHQWNATSRSHNQMKQIVCLLEGIVQISRHGGVRHMNCQ